MKEIIFFTSYLCHVIVNETLSNVLYFDSTTSESIHPNRAGFRALHRNGVLVCDLGFFSRLHLLYEKGIALNRKKDAIIDMEKKFVSVFHWVES